MIKFNNLKNNSKKKIYNKNNKKYKLNSYKLIINNNQ